MLQTRGEPGAKEDQEGINVYFFIWNLVAARVFLFYNKLNINECL